MNLQLNTSRPSPSGTEPRFSAIPRDRDSVRSGRELSVVVPTFNECPNVPILLARLSHALRHLNWEVIFVDDGSPDGTAECIRRLCAGNQRVRLIYRPGQRGLSSACIAGMRAASAPVVAVMDADLQHDEAILPEMFRRLRAEKRDIVVATRNAHGGSMGEFSASRVALSRAAKLLSRLILRSPLSDPMSGFFVLRRGFFLEVQHRLDGGGFKILLDLLASSSRPVSVGEVGYRFRPRRLGQSKLGLAVVRDYLLMILKKLFAAPADPSSRSVVAQKQGAGQVQRTSPAHASQWAPSPEPSASPAAPCAEA